MESISSNFVSMLWSVHVRGSVVSKLCNEACMVLPMLDESTSRCLLFMKAAAPIIFRRRRNEERGRLVLGHWIGHADWRMLLEAGVRACSPAPDGEHTAW